MIPLPTAPVPIVNVWQPPPPIVQQIDARVFVARDDLIEGGTKARFVPYLIKDAKEVVYGAPFCGGAPVALAAVGRSMKIKVTIFYAKREAPHERQLQAMRLGAYVKWVPMGFMSHVQQKAKAYAAQVGALFLPLGFDVRSAEAPFVTSIRAARENLPAEPDEVWCATSSGMLARCLARAFPGARVKAVTVGLKSRWSEQRFPPNVDLVDCKYKFEQVAHARAPFPACPNYELKAWELCAKQSRGITLFWNVIGA